VTEAELTNHLDAAEKSPKQIAAAVLGLPEKTLRYKLSSDKWCILEILGHLADMEILYAYRIRQMLADKDPVIAPIDQDDWSEESGVSRIVSPGVGRTLRTQPPRQRRVVAAAEGGRLAEVRPPSRIGPSRHCCRLRANDVETRAESSGTNRAAEERSDWEMKVALDRELDQEKSHELSGTRIRCPLCG
jgi:DinB superfamily